MLVCPECRAENVEEARYCQRCGRSLEPVATPLRRIETDENEDLEITPPKPPSMVPGAIVLAVLILGAATLGLWYALRPDPCNEKYSSVLFSYCAEIPEGWQGGSQLAGEGNLDQFAPPDAEAAAEVRVSQLVQTQAATEDYAQQLRTDQEADGLAPGPVEIATLDGEEGLAWDVTVSLEDGSVIRLREVVLVREDGAWHIRLFAAEDVYQDARLDFEGMLDSWHFL